MTTQEFISTDKISTPNANRVLNELALFSGVGMLSEGLRSGFEYMGIKTRTVCHIEREAYAASVLVARMEEGSIPKAPIWSDVCTFDAKAWCGKVDIVVGGFPCTDLSVAGKRAGLDGARSGLFFEIPRIADDCGAWLMLLENVAGIASATASVVDAEEGELDERAAARVVGELADLGWNAEWITISASDVGASHGRARWFCLAWRARLDDTEGRSVRGNEQDKRESAGNGDSIAGASHTLGYPEHLGRDAAKIGCCAAQGNDGDATRTVCACEPSGSGNADGQMGNAGLQHKHLQQRIDGAEHQAAGIELGDSNEQRTHRSGTFGQQAGCGELAHDGSDLADTSSARPQGLQLGRTCNRNRGGQETHGSVSQLCGLFAPGPSDPRWADMLREHPELAPALEPAFRQLVNGLAFNMDDCRAARLKCSGNGVVPTQAAMATILLTRRAGMFKESKAHHSQ